MAVVLREEWDKVTKDVLVPQCTISNCWKEIMNGCSMNEEVTRRLIKLSVCTVILIRSSLYSTKRIFDI